MQGALLGVAGTVVTFYKQLVSFDMNDTKLLALLLCLGSIFLASSGNIISAFNQKKGLPVVQANAFGMMYGGLLLLIISQVAGIPLTFDLSLPYIGSLVYLSAFGSVIAFTTYLNLLGKIGPDKSAYTLLVIPVIAMIMSTLFEGYRWELAGFIGIAMILAGNIFVLYKKKKVTLQVT